MSMKQPDKPRVAIIDWDDHYHTWISGNDEGGPSSVTISMGRTRKTALRAAARRLRSLASECDRMAERGE
jgi:hypothetical protein